jgi:hypothetical protein
MRRTLKQIGREVIQAEKRDNSAAAITYRIGEAIQFYKDGWRFGHVRALGAKLRSGMVQVEHQITGNHWVKASDVRHLVEVLKRMRRGPDGAPVDMLSVLDLAEELNIGREAARQLMKSTRGVVTLPGMFGAGKRVIRRMPRAVLEALLQRKPRG